MCFFVDLWKFLLVGMGGSVLVVEEFCWFSWKDVFVFCVLFCVVVCVGGVGVVFVGMRIVLGCCVDCW